MAEKKDLFGSLMNEKDIPKDEPKMKKEETAASSQDETVKIPRFEKKADPAPVNTPEPEKKETKKDYLNSLATEIDNKPDSFKEERMERIGSPRKKMNPKWFIGIGAALVILLAAGYFLFFAPNIEMPNFVGKTSEEVGTWAKQNSMKTNALTMNSEFNMEVDEGKIISQSVKEGKKITKDQKITLIVSKGANPDDSIDFPDLKNMNLNEINDWVKTNKLLKTKINIVYDTAVEKDKVISYDLKNVAENNFTRGTNLTIQVSKGPQPAGEVTVEDFLKKPLAELETWAKTKKIELSSSEVYSDTIEAGKIVSQSVKGGDVMKQGDTLTVTVSKGKAIKVINFSGYDANQLDAWAAANPVKFIKKEIMNDSVPKGQVISQSVKTGTLVDQNAIIELEISAGLSQMEKSFLKESYHSLLNWISAENVKGAKLSSQEIGSRVYSDTYPKNSVVSYNCYSNGGEVNCNRPLPIGTEIKFTVSAGKRFQLPSYAGKTESVLRSFCDSNSLNCQFEYKSSTSDVSGTILNVLNSGGSEILAGSYVGEDEAIRIVIAENKGNPAVETPKPEPTTEP